MMNVPVENGRRLNGQRTLSEFARPPQLDDYVRNSRSMYVANNQTMILRPLSRKDIFYSGSTTHLSQKSLAGSPLATSTISIPKRLLFGSHSEVNSRRQSTKPLSNLIQDNEIENRDLLLALNDHKTTELVLNEESCGNKCGLKNVLG